MTVYGVPPIGVNMVKWFASGHGVQNDVKNETSAQVTFGENQVVVYQPDETVRLDVRLEENTVWLTQGQMTELFQRDRTVITRHINNVFAEGELDEKSNVHFLHIPFSDKPIKVNSLAE